MTIATILYYWPSIRSRARMVIIPGIGALLDIACGNTGSFNHAAYAPFLRGLRPKLFRHIAPIVRTTVGPPSSPPSSKLARRRDIQGLRAVAVLLVLGYHAFPNRMPGGFIGVDVFFVISGFLITLLLLKELDSGSIKISRFYARRVNRLLPAALVAMLATIAASSLIFGPLKLLTALQDLGWTSIYLVNFHLAELPSGYFASDPSPYLHFWSLAVEEQFYLFWPLILILASRVPGSMKRNIAIALSSIFFGSLALSAVQTASDPAAAFFWPTARVWEFAVGGLLAWVVHYLHIGQSRLVALLAAVIGLIAILLSSFIYSNETPFPGLAALLPTIGTALLIAAGYCSPTNPLTRMLSIAPLVFVGNISYSLYLYHWPILLLGGVVLGPPSLAIQFALIALSFVFATVSYFAIEQSTARLTSLPPRRIIATWLGLAAVAGASAFTATTLIPITGGPAVALHAGVPPRWVPQNVNPPLTALSDDLADVFSSGCFANTVVVCEGGDPNGSQTLVLAGDSHAGQWWPAIHAAGIREHWKVYLIGKNGCPLAEVTVSRGTTSDEWPECSAWQSAVMAEIESLHPDAVIVANNAAGYERSKVSLRGAFAQLWGDGLTSTLKELTKESPVLLIGQTPTLAMEPASCLLSNLKDVDSCATLVDQAVPPALRELNRQVALDVGATYFDPIKILCSASCPVMMDNMVMYHDQFHLSASYAAQLSDEIGVEISRTLQSGEG